MDQSVVARRVEQDIMRLCHAGLDTRTLRVEALRRLRKIVPVDAAFCATVDPATLLFTGSLTEEIPQSTTLAFLTNEFLQDDVTKFVHLAHAARPVQSLYAATRDEPNLSPRYREILAPIGFGDELRAALRIGDVTWGVLCLHRDLTGPGFTPTETDVSGTDRAAPGRRSTDGSSDRGSDHRLSRRRPGSGRAGRRSLDRGRHSAGRAVAGRGQRLAAAQRAPAGRPRRGSPAAGAGTG